MSILDVVVWKVGGTLGTLYSLSGTSSNASTCTLRKKDAVKVKQ